MNRVANDGHGQSVTPCLSVLLPNVETRAVSSSQRSAGAQRSGSHVAGGRTTTIDIPKKLCAASCRGSASQHHCCNPQPCQVRG